MNEPLILVIRIWINRRARGYRAPFSSDMCVALAYSPEAASRIDLRPRGPDRKRIADLITGSVLEQPLAMLSPSRLRAPHSKTTFKNTLLDQGARVERPMVEIACSINDSWSDSDQKRIGSQFQIALSDELAHWLGRPLFSRAQWSAENQGFHPAGGDPGVMRGYGSSGQSTLDAEFDAWSRLAGEAVAFGLARDLESNTPGAPKTSSIRM